MQIIQLYIQGQRVDIFKDESINITDSIQNVKDIDKVFTSFSKSFSLPASKTNNKIFKHYYNFDIVNGFDARKKVSAIIELNNLPFRTGKIKLEGVDMKNNKPHTYRITFFGDIVILKDKLGEKKLSDLNLAAYDLTYSPSEVETKLTTAQSSTNHIICPLITHTQRLFFDSVEHINNNGNLHYHTGSGSNLHGVKWNELKYGIRVNKIIEQIEADYDLQFSSDFFKNTSLEEFDHLFLWLHRKSGKIEDLSGGSKFDTHVNGWTPTDDAVFFIDTTTFGALALEEYLTEFELDLVTASTDPYDVRIELNGEAVYTKTNHTGNLNVDAIAGDFAYGVGEYDVYIIAQGQITFSSIVWRATENETGIPTSIDYDTGSFTTGGAFTFNVAKQMPDMKILDFLAGLFKTFSLTAYVENDIIVVKPLDDFFANPTTYDITEFVDVESSKVDVALPYKEVVFKFKDTATFLAQKYGEINNKTWGETSYNDSSNDLSGSLYKVEAPFGHMLFERLNDVNGGAQKNIQWGWSVNKSQNAYLGSPLLFYPILVSTGQISFVDGVNEKNETTSRKAITQANLPFNSPSLSAFTNTHQLNFAREFSEWTLDSRFGKTLFSEYYTNYITSVFNPKQRLTKVKAYLPMRILLNYNLGDRFVIAGNQYKINSVSTNLLTGESNLELINDL
jgi:hypothetical protein